MLAIIDGARATDNLWGERWAKLSQNAMSNPLQAMSGLGSLEVASSEVGRTLMIAPRRRVRPGSGWPWATACPRSRARPPSDGRTPDNPRRVTASTGC